MKPCRWPNDHKRVPITNRETGMISAEEDAIRPYVTMPLANACPDAPRIEKAVMLAPKSESRNTAGPSERPARKKSSALRRPADDRNAKMPMYSATPRYAKTTRAGIIVWRRDRARGERA